MSSTSALDVIIQAVSPELSGSGAAAANAGATVSADAPSAAPTPSDILAMREKFIVMVP